MNPRAWLLACANCGAHDVIHEKQRVARMRGIAWKRQRVENSIAPVAGISVSIWLPLLASIVLTCDVAVARAAERHAKELTRHIMDITDRAGQGDARPNFLQQIAGRLIVNAIFGVRIFTQIQQGRDFPSLAKTIETAL
ncbi:hypothetical protein ACFQAT_24660 [Undibacterium arcticum]|uniref:hypothetical protein n=1 Tax=Undibacterium arcticum TaxID=1762892 RepID=UPI00360702F8